MKNIRKQWYILLILCIFFVACEQRTPLQYVYISSKPYVVRGKRYIPQKNYEYDEVGLASWYGVRDGFDGKKKATGEIFNSNEFTAAHRTLPLPSIVKVTNLRNNKSVIVLVDDRGPYEYAGRIIDLSYRAAKAIGIDNYKPSKVRVQTLVSDSLKIARYISLYCKKRKDIRGRSWAQIYFQEIYAKRNLK